MRLDIKDFAKIKDAGIIVDGITIIAGENNTGKSTIGKILFSIFNATSNIQDKIINQRVLEIQKICRQIIGNFMANDERMTINPYMTSRKIVHEIQKMLKNEELEYDKIREVIHSSLNIKEDSVEEIEDTVLNKVIEIINLPEKNILLEVLSRYFEEVFSKQVNSLNEPESVAGLDLDIKSKTISLNFKNNVCVSYYSNINILNKAIYIDNPFIVDKLCGGYYDLSITEEFLVELLRHNSEKDIMDGVISSVLAKEKLSEISAVMANIIEGDILEKQDEYYLESKDIISPVSINNLSTGMKSFLILKMLIEKGCIDEKDILILDEPEIHLHPQWQIVYAELIVLLQKYFDLSVVITTHSPYFVDAINIFSVKYGTSEKVNYYLTSIENDWVVMKNVTNNIDLIYKKMASPIQILDTLRYELNNI